MKNRRTVAILVALGAGGLTVSASLATAPAKLPAGPGHDTMVRVCSGCHTPEVVVPQKMTRDGWHEKVEEMASRGALANDAELAEITEYLARNFPAPPLVVPAVPAK